MISSIDSYNKASYDAVVLAVAHQQFESIDFTAFSDDTVIYDIKSFLDKKLTSKRL